MHYSGFNNLNGALHPQAQMMQVQPNLSPIPSPVAGRGRIGGIGMQAQHYYEGQPYGNNCVRYNDHQIYQHSFQEGRNINVHGQHMPQYSMMQMKSKQLPHNVDKNTPGRARSQTRGPFSRTAATRSTTPTPINRNRSIKQRDTFYNEDLNVLRSTESIDEVSQNNNRNLSYSQIENSYFNGDYSVNNQESLNLGLSGKFNKDNSHQLNIINPDQIPIQKVSAPLEPTPTHVARMNKMRLMGLANNNIPIPQPTPISNIRNERLREENNHIIRQSSLISQYYQDKYQQKPTKNSNNTAAAFRDSSPKVLGSYVSRQLEEEVTRLRYLVENQTKKISTLEIKNKELENEIISNRNYKQLYGELLERTNLAGNLGDCDQNSDQNENEKEINVSEDIIEDDLEHEKQTGDNAILKKINSIPKDQKPSKSVENKHSIFSNIHQFSAESALRKAGVPPGRPSYIYRPPNNSESIDVKLAEFHNSRSSLIRWSKVSSTVYLFGTTQVQLRLSRGNLLAKPESSEWGNGNFWPIEKFVAVFEPIERAKMPNN